MVTDRTDKEARIFTPADKPRDQRKSSYQPTGSLCTHKQTQASQNGLTATLSGQNAKSNYEIKSGNSDATFKPFALTASNFNLGDCQD